MPRLLLDPTANDGGAAPAAAPAPTPTPTPAAPAAPQSITLPYEQFQLLAALPARLAEIEARGATALREEQERKIQALAAKGEAEKAVGLLREQATADLTREREERARIERIAKTSWRDAELTRALQGVGDRLVPGAAEHLFALVRDQFSASAEGEGFAVRNATFQAPGDFVKALVADPRYALFVKAPAAGSGAAGSATTPTPAPAAGTPAQFANIGEQVVAQWKAHKAAAPAGGFSMGLRGNRG